MGLFDSTDEHPPSKIRRYIITVVAGLLIIGGGVWWFSRFHTEKHTIRAFMNAVVAGNLQEAYKIWKPEPSYSFKDFQDDWGESGYYGPIRSYMIRDADRLHDSSAADVIVEVSPYSPFPDDHDVAKQAKTKEIKLWVQFKDQSISFPPF